MSSFIPVLNEVVAQDRSRSGLRLVNNNSLVPSSRPIFSLRFTHSPQELLHHTLNLQAPQYQISTGNLKKPIM